MNNPITIGVCTDHLTVHCETLPEDPRLNKTFYNFVRFSGLTRCECKDKNYLMLYGNEEEMFTFIYDVAGEFDLLIV